MNTYAEMKFKNEKRLREPAGAAREEAICHGQGYLKNLPAQCSRVHLDLLGILHDREMSAS